MNGNAFSVFAKVRICKNNNNNNNNVYFPQTDNKQKHRKLNSYIIQNFVIVKKILSELRKINLFLQFRTHFEQFFFSSIPSRKIRRRFEIIYDFIKIRIFATIQKRTFSRTILASAMHLAKKFYFLYPEIS